MSLVILERAFEPATDAAGLAQENAKLSTCLAVREVSFVSAWLAQSGKRAIFVYEAADAESVRNGYRSAGVVFERAWTGDAFTPPS
jgi:hypothetical protein